VTELHDLDSSPSIIRVSRACGMSAEEEGCMYVINWRARRKETSGKARTW
jgi:hypothetical protein